MSEPIYKWANPREWLDQSELSADTILAALLDGIDHDTLQDAFQDEMDEDGYFEPIGEGEPPC